MELDDGRQVGFHTHCIANEFPKAPNGKQRRPCNSSDALASYEHELENGKTIYDATCFSCRQKFFPEEVHKSSIAEALGVSEDGVVYEKKIFENMASKKFKITQEEVKDLWSRTGGKEGNSANNYRGISDETYKFYGFRIELKDNGKVKAVYFPETYNDQLQGYKSRHDPKNFGYGNLGKTGSTNQLSGQCRFPDGGRYVLVVGGEFDMAAAQDMLRNYQKQKGQSDYDRYAVVSPTAGEPSAVKQCRAQYEWFDKFDNIIIGLDNDAVGEEVTEDLVKVLPKEKVRVAKWTGKDPNKMLEDGKERQFLSDFFGAKELVDTGVYNANNDMLEDVIEVLSTPRIQLPPFANKLQEMTKGAGLFTRSIYSLIGDTSVGKSFCAGTPILMYDFTTKNVEDVIKGDLVMGDDGSPRTVLGSHSGTDMMYKVTQQDGVSYVTNSRHILSLRAGFDTNVKGKDRNSSRRCSVNYKKGQIVNISVTDYLKLPKLAKRALKGYKGVLRNLDSGYELKHPWLIGLWLGDGNSAGARITQANSAKEVFTCLEGVAKEFAYGLTVREIPSSSTTSTISLTGGFQDYLRSQNLIKNKHIPREWLTASWETRTELLSGLLDSDGYYSDGKGYEITQKSKALSEGIVNLAKSLGLKCSINKTKKVCQTGAVGTYYRMFISGDLSCLKLRLSYKKPKKSSDLRNNLNTSIKVEELSVDKYYGFEVDGNHLFCLPDMTVVHNSTFIDSWIFHWMFELKDHKVGIVSIEATKGEWVAGMLSTYLENNLWWVPRDEIRNYMNTPEVKDKINHFFYNEFGESRFAIVDDREGTVTSLQKCIERLDRQYGCTIIVNDVLTDILRVEDNEAQARHFNWQSNFVKGGATIFNILHTRKPSDNRGGKITFPDEFDAYGNSIFVQKAAGNFVIGRNKQAPNGDIIEQNTTYLRVPKLRKGVTGNGGAWYYDGDTRQVYDREQYFKDNPDKLPVGYDLSVSSFDKAYWEEGGRGWDGVSTNKGGNFNKKPINNIPVKDIMDDVQL
ncbi:hedgehog/hint domain protein [Vibrio phage 1.101.O._10N.261.45.C6]|nr:hedgehog/hint domain protein [Vibrio phage 1.101.O._10N.261.45.C6]